MNKILAAVVAASGLALASAPALAIPYTNGSFALSAFTSTTTAVNTTTSFTLNPAIIIAGSPVGNFTSVALPVPLSTPSVLDFAAVTGFNFSNALGDFTATSASLTNSGGAPNGFAKWNVTGTFTVGTDFDNTGTVLSANETWSLTQTGGGGNAVSVSGTFNSPARVTSTPEPATLALFGAGLAGLGSLRRRRKSA